MANLASRYDDLGLVQKQLAILQSANQIAHQLNEPTLIAQSECTLAGVELQVGHLDQAVLLANAGSERLAKLKRPDPQFLEDCLEARAAVVNAQGNPAAATKLAEQALTMVLQQDDAIHDLRYSELLGIISDYYKSAGDSIHAFEYSERALAAAEQSGLGDTDGTAIDIHNVASSLLNFGEVTASCDREKQLIERLKASGRSIIPQMAGLYSGCRLRLETRLKRCSGATGASRAHRARTIRFRCSTACRTTHELWSSWED